MVRVIIGLVFVSLFARAAVAADGGLPKVAEKFEVNGHTAMLYAAPRPAEGRPWVWYMPTFKGLSLAQRRVYFEGFLNGGVSLAGIDLGEVRGAPASTGEFTKFYEEMARRGFSAKPIVLGQSRGGLMGLAWAMRNPGKTGAFVGIYPVCNLETWGLKNMPVTLADYKMSEAELRSRIKEFNPLDNLGGLIEKKVPMFVVQGDSDKAVPYEQNAKILKERYEAGGGPITVKVVAGEGHQATPAFFEDKDLLAFVLKQAGGRTPTTAPAAAMRFRQNGVTAHRGGQARSPENTLQSVEEGIAAGADWVEVDVFTTRDGQVVVCHDATTGRVGDKDLRINDATYEELRRVDVATSFRKAAGLTVEQCPAVGPPLLKEVLAVIQRHPDVRLSIQPKDGSTDAAVAIVKEMGMLGQVGFNDGSLEKMKRVKELEPRLVVFWDRPAKVDVAADVATAKKYGLEALVVKAPGVTKEMVGQVKAAGLGMGVWTVNDPGEMGKFFEWGVDRVYTDRPDVAMEVKAGRGK